MLIAGCDGVYVTVIAVGLTEIHNLSLSHTHTHTHTHTHCLITDRTVIKYVSAEVLLRCLSTFVRIRSYKGFLTLFHILIII